MMFYDWLQSRYWIYHFESFEHLLSCILRIFREISLQYWNIIWFLMFWNRQLQLSLAISWLPLEEMLLVQVVHLVNVLTRVLLHVFQPFYLIEGQNPIFSLAGDAVVNVYINHEKKFAFVEMRTVEEASNAMALDGIIFEAKIIFSLFLVTFSKGVIRDILDYYVNFSSNYQSIEY